MGQPLYRLLVRDRLLVNPCHADVASKGGALLHAFLDCDMVVRHPEGFRGTEIG